MLSTPVAKSVEIMEEVVDESRVESEAVVEIGPGEIFPPGVATDALKCQRASCGGRNYPEIVVAESTGSPEPRRTNS